MKDKQTKFNLFEGTEDIATIDDTFFDEFEIEQKEKDELAENDLQEVKDNLETLEETFSLLDEVLGEDTLEKLDEIDIMDEKNSREIVNLNENDSSQSEVSDFGKVKIAAIGVGGCGCNTINRMYEEQIDGIKLIAFDTSEQTLDNTHADQKYLLGKEIFDGHGSGGELEKISQIFEQEKEKIINVLQSVDMLFLTGGIGRGTGTIGLIEIGNIARELGVLTIGFATLPRKNEIQQNVVDKYYPKFREAVDSNVVIENERMHQIARNLPIGQALKFADRMLVDGITGISALITNPGKINLDYADIKTAFSNQGSCVMGVGYGKGEQSVVQAIEESMHSELVNFENIKSSRIIIFNITCARNSVTIDQATKGTDLIYAYNTSKNIEHLLFGYSYDESMGEEVKVTFIATGTHPTKINYLNEQKENINEIKEDKIKISNDGGIEEKINIFNSIDPIEKEEDKNKLFKPDFFAKK